MKKLFTLIAISLFLGGCAVQNDVAVNRSLEYKPSCGHVDCDIQAIHHHLVFSN